MAFQLLNPFTLIPLLVLTVIVFAETSKNLQSAIVKPQLVPRPPWQCHLSDIYILLFQFCVSGWLTYEPDEEYGPLWNVGGLIVLWSLQGFVWYLAIRSMSWNRVADPLRRFMILGFVFPLVLFFPLMSCMVPMMCVFPALVALLPLFIYLNIMYLFAAWAYKPVVEMSKWRRLVPQPR
jgi:hypothetical protein